MNNSHEPLMPCPFCGSQAWLRKKRESRDQDGVSTQVPLFAIVCTHNPCGCRTQWRRTIRHAVTNWSRRAESKTD